MKKKLTLFLYLCTIMACNAQVDIYALHRKDTSLKEIQQAIEYNLDSIRILDFNYIQIPKPPNTKKSYYYNYFTEKARLRMIELFEGKWNEVELESRLAHSLEYEKDTLNPRNGFYKQAKKIAEQDSISFLKVWDSMLTNRKEESRKSIIQSNWVPREIVSIAGYLKDPRFLPYLKKLVDSVHIADVELALARYGVEPYHSNAIKKYSYSDNFHRNYLTKLNYICTKEAIEEIYKYAMNEEEIICDSNGEECWGFTAQSGMAVLAQVFNSHSMRNELNMIDSEYYKINKQPDKEYLERMRKVTERYYKTFSMDNVDCENVLIYAW